MIVAPQPEAVEAGALALGDGGNCVDAAIACGLVQNLDLRDSVVRARDYVLEAIRSAPGFGAGHGPLNHAHTLKDKY